ncbi:unnamed protein product [Pylaiella littoralis]
MVKFSAGFALVSALSVASAATTYRVRVRNLTYQQPFSPIFVVAHTRDISLFQEGQVASDAIRTMAEDGDNSALVELAGSEEVSQYICGAVVGDAPVFPGGEWRGTMEVDDDCEDPKFSLVSMLINTNDGFMGIDTDDLETTKVYPPCYDAGTEINNEVCTDIPGPGCGADSGNAQAGEGEGYIHVHRGVHGIADLADSEYDWRNPVAEVFVSKQH